VILDWEAAAEAGIAHAGGKGWQLALLARFGLPVPQGIVIDATAAAGRLAGAPLPPDLATALSRELESRGWINVPLAVRSSAVAEDSARASFAGIFRSCLNVQGREGVFRSVGEVLDSAVSPTAMAYRQRLEVPDADAGMAVVVMPLLPAVASGVAFTCDPLSGRDDQIVIHAHWGLGESLVSGQIEADEYRLQEDPLTQQLSLVHQRLGAKARTTALAANGGTELRETPVELATQAVLNVSNALALGELVRDVAFALDYAKPFHDIEWVWDGQRFWIVQARPVTVKGRYTYPELLNQPALWSRGNSRDIVPDPLSPIDWSLMRTLVNRMMTRTAELAGYRTLPGAQRTALRHGRLYFETSILQWEGFDAFDVPPQAYNQLLGGHQPQIRVARPTLLQRFARARRSARFLIGCIRPRLQAETIFERSHRWAAMRVEAELPANDREWGRALRQDLAFMAGSDDLFLLLAAGSVLFILVDLLEKYFPGEGHALTASLTAGGPPSVTAAQAYALIELAQVASTDPSALSWLRSERRIGAEWSTALSADSPFRKAFASFLHRYGHRAVYETYLRNPRWREAPDYLLESVLNLIGSEPSQLRERQATAAARAQARLRESLPWRYRGLIPLLVKLTRVERNVREGARSAFVAHYGVIRRYALELGERHTGAGGFGHRDEAFNLTLHELLALADGRLSAAAAAQRASGRQKRLEQYASDAGPEVILEGAVAAAEQQSTPGPAAQDLVHEASSEKIWRGTVVGSGYARGVALVAHHPNDTLTMKSGAILVVPSTDPSWTPAFLKASGLVMETGGYLSHGAIVAREFGIPAVVNLPGILARIRDGDEVEVDAGRGIVRVIGDQSR
jgi:rifampicin phosphotransferase